MRPVPAWGVAMKKQISYAFYRQVDPVHRLSFRFTHLKFSLKKSPKAQGYLGTRSVGYLPSRHSSNTFLHAFRDFGSSSQLACIQAREARV